MNKFKTIGESDFGDICEIFDAFFRDIRINKDKTEICKITKKEAKQGSNKKIKIHVAQICEKCDKDVKCKSCYGRGYYFTQKEIDIKIPPNVKNNDMIRLKEQGNHLIKEEKKGNLYIKLHVYGDKSERKGRIIYE